MKKTRNLLAARLFLILAFFLFTRPILCATKDLTNTWSPQQTDPTIDMGSGQHQFVFDGLGNAYAVWKTDQFPSAALKTSRFSKDTQSWGTVHELDNGYNLSYRLSVDSAGNALVSWAKANSITLEDWEVKATYYHVSLSWQAWTPFIKTIDTIPGDITPAVSTAISNNGTTIIGWSYGDPAATTKATLYQQIQDWNTWDPNTYLKTNFPSGYYLTNIAMDDNGNAIFALKPPLDEDQFIYATYFDGSTVWNTWDPSILLKKISINTPSFHESVAMNSQGNAAFVWEEGDFFLTTTVVSTFFDISQTWTLWEPVLKTIDSGTLPSLSINNSNNVFFCYVNNPGSTNEARISRYDGSGWNAWTPSTTILYSGILVLGSTNVGVDEIGNAAAMYTVLKTDTITLEKFIQVQSSLYDLQNDSWKDPVCVSIPVKIGNIESFGTPMLAVRKPNPDITSIMAMIMWPNIPFGGTFAQTIPFPLQTFIDVQPAQGIVTDAVSDAVGTFHIISISNGTAYELINKKTDPSTKWTQQQISKSSQVATDAKIAVTSEGFTSIAYIVAGITGNETWVKINDQDPKKISAPDEDSIDVNVAVSENLKTALLRLSKPIIVKKCLDDLDSTFDSEGYRSTPDTGEVIFEVRDPESTLNYYKVLSPGPAFEAALAQSTYSNIYATWNLYSSMNGTSTIQAVYGIFDPSINSWLWQNTLELSASGSVENPRVAVNPMDNLTVFAWKEWDGSNWRVNSTIYFQDTPGSTFWNSWSHTTTYLSPAGYDVLDIVESGTTIKSPIITMTSSGSPWVIWTLKVGAVTRIQAAYFDNTAENKNWNLPSITRGNPPSIPPFISPAGVSASLPCASSSSQGNAIFAYNVGKFTYYTLWDSNSKTFSQPIKTNFPPSQLESGPFCLTNVNGTRSGVATTVFAPSRANNNQPIWVTLPKNIADQIIELERAELHCPVILYPEDFGTTGTILDTPGYYTLCGDIPWTAESGASAITTSTSHVIIDLNNHTIYQTNPGTPANGITIDPDVHDVTIKNGTLSAFGTNGIHVNSSTGSGCYTIKFENINLESCGNNGIYLQGNTGSQIHNCSFLNCLITKSTHTGCELLNCQDIDINKCNFTNNGNDGCYANLSSKLSFAHCTFDDNTEFGAEADGSSTISFNTCTFNNNSSSSSAAGGLSCTGPGSVVVKKCIANSNNSSGSYDCFGIRLLGLPNPLSGTIESCSASSNSSVDGYCYGIYSYINDVVDCQAIGNKATGSGTCIGIAQLAAGKVSDCTACGNKAGITANGIGIRAVGAIPAINIVITECSCFANSGMGVQNNTLISSITGVVSGNNGINFGGTNPAQYAKRDRLGNHWEIGKQENISLETSGFNQVGCQTYLDAAAFGTTGTVIDKPGYYILCQDLTFTTGSVTAVTIKSDYVTFDMNGKSISGSGLNTGIKIDENHHDIAINNGTISGFSSIGLQILAYCHHIDLKEISMSSSSCAHGILCAGTSDNPIHDCTIQQCRINGLNLAKVGLFGPQALQLSYCNDMKFSEDHFNFNSGDEIVVANIANSDKCQFNNCQFNDNEGTGTVMVMNSENSDTLLLDSCSFNNNSAAQGSLDMFKGQTSGSIIKTTQFVNNSADFDLTCIDLDSTSTGNCITSCSIVHNNAQDGNCTGINLDGAGNAVEKCRIVDNNGSDGQAAIVVLGDDNTIIGCDLFANGSANNWNGISIKNTADKTSVKHCLVCSHAQYGIDNQGSNSIVVGNASGNNTLGNYNNADALSFYMTGTDIPQPVYEYDNVTFTLS